MLSIIIYLIITREEKSYMANGKEKCRNCGMKINPNFLYCPYCKEEIKKICDCCGKLIDIDWRYCTFCENNEENENIELKESQADEKIDNIQLEIEGIGDAESLIFKWDKEVIDL